MAGKWLAKITIVLIPKAPSLTRRLTTVNAAAATAPHPLAFTVSCLIANARLANPARAPTDPRTTTKIANVATRFAFRPLATFALQKFHCVRPPAWLANFATLRRQIAMSAPLVGIDL